LDSKEEDEGSSFSLTSWHLHAQKDILSQIKEVAEKLEKQQILRVMKWVR